MRLRLSTSLAALGLALGAIPTVSSTISAQAPAPIEYYRLAHGFIAESFNEDGMARGSGFASPNPWGPYTAYLMATNAKGQRTWRIEGYRPNPGGMTAQGSTCYLFEGNSRALLVDTADNVPDEPGKTDLKTVTRHLLGHQNDGSVKSNPVDFVVANTHSHGDHTGRNAIMSDRTVYYPDLDWPRANAPANYVPIREGGGVTSHGNSVGEIDLGGRTIVAIDIHEHTPGSTGYLDRENRMIATGDAIGSGYVWAHFGSMTQYSQAVHHLQDVLRPLDRVAVLPAHFYQVKQGGRGKPPLNGRPLDKAYVDDHVRVADGILDGTVVGEPYRSVGRNAAIATIDSGQVVYTLGNLYPGGLYESTGDKSKYHAIAIPRLSASRAYKAATPAWQAASPDARFGGVEQIKVGLYLIRDYANESMYLVVGSTRALLIGTGSGTPGLAEFVKRLAGPVPVDVAVTSDDPGQVGGLAQFPGAVAWLPPGVQRPGGGRSMTLADGARINVGEDQAGRPIVLEVHPLSGHSVSGVTLLDVNNRVLFSGDALGTQGNDAGLILNDSLEAFSAALTRWRARTDGKYDVVYTAHNYQWLTVPAYVTEVQAAVTRGVTEGPAALIDSVRLPGRKMIRSPGAADVVASVVPK